MFFLVMLLNLLLFVLLLKLTTKNIIKFFPKKINFSEKKIPICGGIFLILFYFLNFLIVLIDGFFMFSKEAKTMFFDSLIWIIIYYFSTLLPGVGGIIDDIYGQQTQKGLKGHIKYFLLKKKLSTGMLKIFFSLVASFIFIIYEIKFSMVIYPEQVRTNYILHFFILLLSTNFLNLMDLRPGRTVKIFLIVSTISFFIIPLLDSCNYVFSYPYIECRTVNLPFDSLSYLAIMIALLFYLPYDLSGKIMLGDAGSNFLGFIMGAIIVILYPLPLQIIWLIFLIIVHIYAEKYSISDLIESNKFLLFFDNLFLPQEIIEKKRQVYEERKRKLED